MKNLYSIFVLIFSIILISSCSDDSSTEASGNAENNSEKKEANNVGGKDETARINGEDIQYYPNTKIMKAKGIFDENGERHGIWKGYDKKGYELSITDYNHGQKHGISIVKYPNGSIFYTGEYRNDKQVGVWVYYDQDGTEKNREDYGK